jgi:hypothetical protein
MSQKHFANLAQGILGEPDPISLWTDQLKVFGTPIKTVIKSGSKIVCPTAGQGSEIHALMTVFDKDWNNIKKNVVAMDKFICFTNRINRVYNIQAEAKDFLKEESIDMNNAVWLLNPPYNDGSKGNAPIYQHFVEKVKLYKPKAAIIIVQANWLMQKSKLGKQMRKDLKEIGIKRLTINAVDAFPKAKVRTVSMLCESGYTGSVTLADAVTKDHRVIKNFDDLIPFLGHSGKFDLIDRLRSLGGSWTTRSGKEGDTNKWRIVVSYKNFEIKKDPLGHMKIIEPNFTKQSGYRVFSEYDTEADAISALEIYKSFWRSKLITFILRYTRVSNTLDNPQIAWVPKVALTKVYTEEEVYKLFNLTQAEIDLVEDEFKSNP